MLQPSRTVDYVSRGSQGRVARSTLSTNHNLDLLRNIVHVLVFFSLYNCLNVASKIKPIFIVFCDNSASVNFILQDDEIEDEDSEGN